MLPSSFVSAAEQGLRAGEIMMIAVLAICSFCSPFINFKTKKPHVEATRVGHVLHDAARAYGMAVCQC